MSIKKRQNNEILLKAQFAARYKYNVAENLNKICFWLSFSPLVFLFPFIVEMEKEILVSTLVIDIIIITLSFLVQRLVTQAASLRTYFDNRLFNFEDENIDSSHVEEMALQLFNKHFTVAMTQIKNTAQDTPPGVKDWYDISDDEDDQDVIFKCQCENGWWTKKMFVRLIVNYCIYFGIIIIILLLLKNGFKIDTFDLFIATSGIFLKFIERIIALIKYIIVSFKMEGAIAILKIYKTNEQLKRLQCFINERRAIPILLPNNAHRKKASWWSHLYHETH